MMVDMYSRSCQPIRQPRFGKRYLRCLVMMFVFSPLVVSAVEIKWTPAPDENKGDTYSVQDRQMLLQLDQQISSSSNPQDSLQRIADSNGIDPNQLQDILMENRKFFQHNNGGGGGGGGAISSVPREPLTTMLLKAIAGVFMGSWKIANKYPRASTTLFMVVCVSLWIAWNAPRNGVVLDSGGNRGPTTLLVPPRSYMENRLLESAWWKVDEPSCVSQPIERREVWRQLEEARTLEKGNKDTETYLEGDVLWNSDFPKKIRASGKLLKAAYLERVVELDLVLPDQESEVDRMADELLLQQFLQGQAQRLLRDSPQLTEFVLEPRMRFLPSQIDPDFGVWMVTGLGRWGAIGYLPVLLERADENWKYDKSANQSVLASLVLTTLPGSYWEGQAFYVRVVKRETNIGNQRPVVVVQVAWVAAGRSSGAGKRRPPPILLPKTVVNRILESLCSSLRTSLAMRTQQAWARQAQSARVASRAKLSADERRQTRASRERQLEEMAAERRRRRFAQNPNQGRYRPSGERMRSPNNAVYK